jgi:hypothetical protein
MVTALQQIQLHWNKKQMLREEKIVDGSYQQNHRKNSKIKASIKWIENFRRDIQWTPVHAGHKWCTFHFTWLKYKTLPKAYQTTSRSISISSIKHQYVWRVSIVGWGTMLQARRRRVQDPMRSLKFFNLPNPSSCTRIWGFTQPLTEVSTRDRKIMFLWSGAQPARKPDNLTALCEPTI